jgi:hypothetical protein
VEIGAVVPEGAFLGCEEAGCDELVLVLVVVLALVVDLAGSVDKTLSLMLLLSAFSCWLGDVKITTAVHLSGYMVDLRRGRAWADEVRGEGEGAVEGWGRG